MLLWGVVLLKINIDKDRLLAGLDLSRVAERLGIQIKKRYADCLWHNEKTASMYFDDKRQAFHCFSCKKSGDAIALVMKYKDIEFIPACEWLNDVFGCNAIEYGDETAADKDRRKTSRILQAAGDNARKKMIIIYQFLEVYQARQFDKLGDDTKAYEQLCGEVYRAKELRQCHDNELVIVEAARLESICRQYSNNFYEYLADYDVRYHKMIEDIKSLYEPSSIIDKFLKDSKKARKKYNCEVWCGK